ncbi:hypothetical protein ETD83_17545 [Actinomadura soli]|uniref:Uncharacterized protein n=1 Tax=Actinomadura soli TaxID=2508997 RepID=A0A5C4JBV2_9ACTN|nr:hypothetical protein [Actinomadura soli]TMR00142.1 hypothetical protein ETD83_17545 [Actinomadura soli]
MRTAIWDEDAGLWSTLRTLVGAMRTGDDYDFTELLALLRTLVGAMRTGTGKTRAEGFMLRTLVGAMRTPR